MGPFGAGKSHLGRRLDAEGIARYTELEPLVYDRFEIDGTFEVEEATKYIRSFYLDELSRNEGVVALESTGITQRPLLLEVMERYRVALIWLATPKGVCLERIKRRNIDAIRPIRVCKANEFYDYWTAEIAPQYEFSLQIDGTDGESAMHEIKRFISEGVA